MNLSIKNRIGLISSNMLSIARINRRVPIKLTEQQGIVIVSIPEGDFAIPAARRWHRYKRGWKIRSARLLRQFGVGDIISLTSDDVVIDIGANVGEFSLGAAGLGAKVFAIDGDPCAYQCLYHNCRDSSLVSTYPYVLWKEETELTFFSEPADADSSIFKPITHRNVKKLAVKTRTLDAFAAEAGIEQISLIKCDAEGAEPEIILGGQSVLKKTKVVAFDTGAERMGEETSDECEVLLTELGFSVHHDRRPNRKITFGIRNS